MSENQGLEKAKKEETLAYLQSLNYKQLLDSQVLNNKFIELWNSIHGDKQGEIKFHKEKFNFSRIVSEDANLRIATPVSLYGCMLDLAVNGLSLDKGKNPLCYLMTRNNTKADGSKEKVAYLEISAYGELTLRIRNGQIKHADNPVIVYDGDLIKVGLNVNNGKNIVKEYEPLIPRKANAAIVGGFIRIERMDGSYECVWRDIQDMDRLKGFSNKQNYGSASNDKSNALYKSENGHIDSAFMAAKIIKHAFSTYPKVGVGAFTSLASNVTEEEPKQIDYGFTTAEEIKTETQEIQVIDKPVSQSNQQFIHSNFASGENVEGYVAPTEDNDEF